jgi:hypothetical protein
VTHGLTKGAKAGIGIGVAVGVLILSVIIIYVVRLKRRASQTEKQSAAIQRDMNRESVIQELEPNAQVPNKGAGYTAVELPTLSVDKPVYEIGGRPVGGV